MYELKLTSPSVVERMRHCLAKWWLQLKVLRIPNCARFVHYSASRLLNCTSLGETELNSTGEWGRDAMVSSNRLMRYTLLASYRVRMGDDWNICKCQ